jgi:hypothetical protein
MNDNNNHNNNNLESNRTIVSLVSIGPLVSNGSLVSIVLGGRSWSYCRGCLHRSTFQIAACIITSSTISNRAFAVKNARCSRSGQNCHIVCV